MNRIGKLLFALTSLAPSTVAYAINRFSNGDNSNAIRWLVIGGLLIFVCFAIFFGALRRLQREPLVTKKVRLADKEILAFLLAYLLPLASTARPDFSGDILTAVFIYAIIGLCVYHSNAFTFNPLLAFIGYHFYEIDNDAGMTYLLLSRKPLHANESTLRVVRFGEYLFVDTGE